MSECVPKLYEAVSLVSSRLSSIVFEKRGEEILNHIQTRSLPNESEAEAGLRLGLTCLLVEALIPQEERK